MQIIKRKEKVGNVLFIIALAIELLIMMTDHSAITLPLRGRFAQLAFVLFGIKILTTNYTKKQWVWIIFLALLGSVSYFTCDDEYFLRVAVMVVAAKDIDMKLTGRMILFGALAGTTVIVILSLTGVLGQAVDIRHYGRGVEEARWCLGFSHANNIHDMFWYLCGFFFLLYQRKCNWKHYMVLTLMNLLLFYFTVSRNGFVTAQLLIIGGALLHYIPSLNQKIILYLLSIAGVSACIFLTVFGGLCGIANPFIAFCNRFLTGRLEMIYEYAPVLKWTLFPPAQRILYVDNGFAILFSEYGIVIGILYICLIVALIFDLYQKQNGIGLAFLTTIVFVTFMETTFILNTSLLCNPMYFLLFNEWYQMDTKQQMRCASESV